MAKGSAMGLWRGKKGSSVFYKLTNSNNAQKQGIRERVYEVSNPKTANQADQRMKLLPAQRIAGALREIIDRGWQGVDYGTKSRNAFLSKALSMKSGYPFIDKDSDLTVPGQYQITKGTLTGIVCEFVQDEGNALITRLYLADDFIVDTTTTIGQLSQSILDNTPGVMEGDQLTFVACYTDDMDLAELTDVNYFWDYCSFFLDPNDSTLVSDLSLAFVESQYGLSFNQKVSEDGGMLAGAVVLSRLGSTGTYLRSTAKLVVRDELAGWFTQATKQRARRSYQYNDANDEPSVGPDWPVDGDVDYEASYEAELTLSGLTGVYASANGQQIMVRRNQVDDTLVAVYYKAGTLDPNAHCVVKPNGSVIVVGTLENQTEVAVSNCPQVANLPQILWQS